MRIFRYLRGLHEQRGLCQLWGLFIYLQCAVLNYVTKAEWSVFISLWRCGYGQSYGNCK
jgi:hypothetical protein